MAMEAISLNSPTENVSPKINKCDADSTLLRQDSDTYNYGTVGDLGSLTRMSNDNSPTIALHPKSSLSTNSPTQETAAYPKTLLTGRRHSSILSNALIDKPMIPSDEHSNGGPQPDGTYLGPHTMGFRFQ